MSILLYDPAFSVRYAPEEPRSWISSSLVSDLMLPVSDGSCSLHISVESCDSHFLFSQSLTMLIQFETHSPQLLLGNDWFLLFQDMMAGHSVSIGPERIYFPVRSMPTSFSLWDVDGKCSTLFHSLRDLIILLRWPHSSFTNVFLVCSGLSCKLVIPPSRSHIIAHPCGYIFSHPCGYTFARPCGYIIPLRTARFIPCSCLPVICCSS